MSPFDSFIRFLPRKLRQSSRIALAAVTVFVSSAVWSTDVSAGKSDDTLNVALGSEIATLEYYMSSGRPAIFMSHHLFDTLLYKDAKSGEIVPALASSYEFTNDTTIEFTLRKGVKFHDGSDLTADDVVATLNRAADPKYGAVYQIAVKWIDRAEKLDDYKVRVTMKEPYPVALEWVAGFLPIYPSDYYEKVGKEGFALKPVGTGPYKLAAMDPGTHWRLERFADHYEGSPKGNAIKFIDMRVYPEVNTQLTGLMTKKIDFMWKFSADIAKRLEGRDGIDIKNASIMRINQIALNPAKGKPTSDIRVRRALNHAVNREAIMKSIIGGSSSVIATACNPVQFGCSTDVTSYSYDPKKAKALLKEAGYGEGMPLKVLVMKSGAVSRNMVEAVLADLAKVGVTADIETQQWAAARKKWINDEDDIMIASWGSWGIGDVAMITSEWFGSSSVNRTGDQKVVELLNVADRSTDRSVREEKYAQALKRIADQAYWIPLWTFNVNYALNDEVNFTLDADEIARFFNATWK
ncbi:ABC transporter substrate-binding protein [Thalassospiraceae bacterium LMO-JJ14]|nr:ABC transporter substrate-binding protein [Thalassospiraceae bacterium LMO-JJ14]